MTESDEVEHETVLVKKSAASSKYHKPDPSDPSLPACSVNDNTTPDDWRERSREFGETWCSKCRNPRCWGERPDGCEGHRENWPV